jgi:hypothetical protein
MILQNIALNRVMQLCYFKVFASGLECLDTFWLLIPLGLGLRFVMVTFDILQIGTVANVQICICLHQTVY